MDTSRFFAMSLGGTPLACGFVVNTMQAYPAVLVLDCTHPPQSEPPRNHNDLNLALALAAAVGAPRTYLTHVSHDPEAWMALGRARLGLRQSDAAVAAFQRVLMLDSTHAEAKWALQQLEFELGRSLMEPGGV